MAKITTSHGRVSLPVMAKCHHLSLQSRQSVTACQGKVSPLVMAVSPPVMAKCHNLSWHSVTTCHSKVSLPEMAKCQSVTTCLCKVSPPVKAKCYRRHRHFITCHGKVLPHVMAVSSHVKKKYHLLSWQCHHMSWQSVTACHGKLSLPAMAKCHHLS